MAKQTCTDRILEWLKKPETKDHIKAAGQNLDKKTIQKLENSIRNTGKNLFRAGGISINDAMDKAQKIVLEGLKEEMNSYRVMARMSAIKLAQRTLEANGNEWDAKILESTWFSGSLHEGIGVKGGIGIDSNTNYTLLTNSNGGILNELEKINGITIIKDKKQARLVADQIIKQKFTNDSIGKVAKVLDNQNKIGIKLLRQAGAPIKELAGRVTKQFHDPIRILNPKGFNERLSAKLGVSKPELLIKKISSLGSREFEKLKVDTAFEMWKDYVKPRLNWNLSFLDINHENENAIDKSLRGSFDSILFKVNSKNIKSPVDMGDSEIFSKPITRQSSIATRIANKQRTLHFKDGNSFMDYQETYGAGNLLTAIDRDARSLARSLAVIKKFGPNAEAVYKKLKDQIEEKNKYPSTFKYTKKMDRQMDLVTGKLYGGTSSKIAQYIQNLESFNNLTKLGGVVFHSVSDISNQWGSMTYAGMTFPEKITQQFDNFQRMFKAGSKEEQEFRDCLGVGTRHIIGSVNRFGVDPNSFGGMLSKADSIMFKLNGLSWWDDGLKRGTMATYSRYLAKNAGKSFNELNPKLQRLLKLYNWKPEEWDVWRNNGLKIVDKKTYLTPDSFFEASEEELKGLELTREELHQKAMMFLEDQYKYVVPQASLLDQANRALRMQTPAGAAVNLLLQYKSYGINFVRNVLMRNLQGSDNKYEAFAALTQTIVGTMVLGYAGDTALGLLKNEMPAPLTGDHAAHTWAKAILPALGIFGDVAEAATSSKADMFSELLGPSASFANDARSYFIKMAKRSYESPSIRDRKSSLLLSYEFAKRNMPFMNTPIAQVAMHYLIGKEIMDYIQPGIFEEMRQQSENHKGSTPIIP
jgi:hypothetical protein